jgi:hypothetical protein
LTSPIDGFAFGLKRIHKREQDFIRQLDCMGLPADSELLAGGVTTSERSRFL